MKRIRSDQFRSMAGGKGSGDADMAFYAPALPQFMELTVVSETEPSPYGRPSEKKDLSLRGSPGWEQRIRTVLPGGKRVPLRSAARPGPGARLQAPVLQDRSAHRQMCVKTLFSPAGVYGGFAYNSSSPNQFPLRLNVSLSRAQVRMQCGSRIRILFQPGIHRFPGVGSVLRHRPGSRDRSTLRAARRRPVPHSPLSTIPPFHFRMWIVTSVFGSDSSGFQPFCRFLFQKNCQFQFQFQEHPKMQILSRIAVSVHRFIDTPIPRPSDSKNQCLRSRFFH